MTDTIECFTGFYLEKDKAAVCGIVLSDGTNKKPSLNEKPEGDYLNGLFELLIERVEFWKGKLHDRHLVLRIHVHHKNANFKKVLDKAIKAAKTARGYQGRNVSMTLRHLGS